MKTNSIIIFITLIVMFNFSSCKKTEADPEFVNSSITGIYIGKTATGVATTVTIIKLSNSTFNLNMKAPTAYTDITFSSVKMTGANAFEIKATAKGQGSPSDHYHEGSGAIDGKNLNFTTKFFNGGVTLSFTGTK